MTPAARIAALACGVAATGALAQSYPARPIRLVVPFVAGGGTDLVARAIGQRIGEAMGQTVVVDNRAGAGGVIGADLVAKAPADGYTLLMGTPGPLTINPNLQAKMPYDSLRDFAPVSLATISPFVLAVNPQLAATSVKDLIALARAKPGALNYGSAGTGAVSHLAAEQFKALAAVDIAHVPYRGSALSVTEVISGQLQMLIDNLPVVLPHGRSGRLRLLAVGTRKRSAMAPELPTMEEAGVPGYEASTAFGVLAPANTPRPVLGRLSAEIVRALKTSEMRERLASQGLEAMGSSEAEYAAHLRDELAKVARIVKLARIGVQ